MTVRPWNQDVFPPKGRVLKLIRNLIIDQLSVDMSRQCQTLDGNFLFWALPSLPLTAVLTALDA